VLQILRVKREREISGTFIDGLECSSNILGISQNLFGLSTRDKETSSKSKNFNEY